MCTAANRPRANPPILSESLFDVRDIERDAFWEGRAVTTGLWLGALYVLISIGALLWFASTSYTSISELPVSYRRLVILIGTFVSTGPPAYFWLEAKAFDWWLNQKITDVEKQKRLRETYKLNVENGKAFWAGILAVYAAVLLKWG